MRIWLVLAVAGLARVAAAAPPAGYACAPGTANKGVGCTCPAGYTEVRDEDNIAGCAKKGGGTAPVKVDDDAVECGKVDVALVKTYGSDLSVEEQRGFRATFGAAAVQRCKTDPWSKAARTCLGSAAIAETAYECLDKLSPLQRGALDVEAARAHPINVTVDKSELRVRGTIVFATTTATISDFSKPTLAAIAKALADNPKLRVEIRAHTDNVGDAGANLKISTERANAVRAALIATGVAGDRLTAKGFGQTMPIADNGSAWGRARNRRVQFAIVEAAGPERDPAPPLTDVVHFERIDAKIPPAATAFLDGVVTTLKRQSAARLRIVGHADNTERDGEALSRARATAVRAYLVDHGIDGGRLEVVARGAAEPAVDNGTEAGRSANRRVELVVVTATSREADAREEYRLADAAYAKRDYATAATHFERGFALDPRPAFMFNLAQSRRLNGERDRAIAAYRRYLELEPRGPHAGDARRALDEMRPR